MAKTNNKIENVVNRNNYNAVRTDLGNVNWGTVYETRDVNQYYDKFYNIPSSIVNKNKTQWKMNSRFRKAENKSPWITKNIMNRILLVRGDRSCIKFTNKTVR